MLLILRIALRRGSFHVGSAQEVAVLYPIQNDVRNRFDLSGIWDFQTDPEEVGKQNGWFDGLAEPRPIAVPGSWNEQYEDIFNYLGLAWYVKRTYIPQGWRGERLFIRVGSANYFGTVYVNGTKVGSHEAGHLPFAFEITELVRWDEENVIAVSVENHLKPTRVPSGNIPSALGAFASFPRTTFEFFPFAGLHRPVVLYTVAQNYIEDVTVVTGIDGADGSVRVTVELDAATETQGSVRLENVVAYPRSGTVKPTWSIPCTFYGSLPAPCSCSSDPGMIVRSSLVFEGSASRSDGCLTRTATASSRYSRLTDGAVHPPVRPRLSSGAAR